MGCFLIGVTGEAYTVNGEALLGSVSDDPYDIRTFVRSIHPQGQIAHVGTELAVTRPPSFAERGYFCSEGDTSRGVNAAGLSFTCAMLFESTSEAKKEESTSFSLLIRKVMDECTSVKEAVHLFKNVNSVNPPFSVLLADGEGELAHLEAGSFGVEVLHHYTKDKPGAVFAVNCYQSKNSIKYNDPKAVADNPENNNGYRLQRGQDLCENWKGSIDVDVISRILSDHAHRDRDPETNPLLDAWGFSICNHGTRQQNENFSQPLPWGTVSAEILEPSTCTLYYCYGWPCGEPRQFIDQLYQENSWGKFHPFSIEKDASSVPVNMLTDVNGRLL